MALKAREDFRTASREPTAAERRRAATRTRILAAALRDWLSPGRIESARDAARALAEAHGIEGKLARTEELLLEVARERSGATGS